MSTKRHWDSRGWLWLTRCLPGDYVLPMVLPCASLADLEWETEWVGMPIHRGHATIIGRLPEHLILVDVPAKTLQFEVHERECPPYDVYDAEALAVRLRNITNLRKSIRPFTDTAGGWEGLVKVRLDFDCELEWGQA